MTLRSFVFASLLSMLCALAGAQSWQSAYEEGLKAARAPDWAAARAHFQQAAAYRTEDVAGATTLPGPVSEQRRWRNGSPYSPNFLAAYSSYRLGLASADPEAAKVHLQTSAAEFEALLAKGQVSKETLFFLDRIYNRLDDTAKRLDLEARARQAKPNFRVDTEVVAPEDLAVINNAPATTGPNVTVIRPGENPTTIRPNTNPGSVPNTAPVGTVPSIQTKYALIIGNSLSRLPEGAMDYGADDAQAIREALVTHAGYPEANVDLVLNATHEQVLASARALAERVPEDGVVFIYFAGNGVNIDGKDYLAGVDTSSLTDVSSMVSKMELYRLFISKGAKIFAFFQVPRQIMNGTYFGKEVPLVGAVSQVQSTMQGDVVYSVTRGGRQRGLFTDAMVNTLQGLRSNRIPINEFGWQVFDRIRGGGGANRGGGGGRQVPTLPVLTHMSPEERF